MHKVIAFSNKSTQIFSSTTNCIIC